MLTGCVPTVAFPYCFWGRTTALLRLLIRGSTRVRQMLPASQWRSKYPNSILQIARVNPRAIRCE